MSKFIANAVCKGQKPRQLMGTTFFHRNTLLARMMRDRAKVRYLVAPTGFGKTLLAGSYVQIVNGYEHAVWLNAQNPCFLRDLDAGSIADEILDVTREGDVVVIDDLPRLEKPRVRQAWSLCHRLITAGREVIVATTPMAHPFKHMAKSCLTLNPTDFLYTDDDLESVRSMSISGQYNYAEDARVRRVPALATHSPGCFEQFLVAHIDDFEDIYQAGITFVMVALSRGSVDDISQVLGKAISIADLSPDFMRPFVRINEFRSEFDASDFPMREIARAFSPVIHQIAPALGMSDSGVLVLAIANTLMKKGSPDRAVQLVRLLSLQAVRAAWLRETQKTLLDTGAWVAGEVLYESLRGTRYFNDEYLMTASAVRRFMLEQPQAHDDLARISRRTQASVPIRMQAAALALLGTETEEEANLIVKNLALTEQNIERTEGEIDQTAELFDCMQAMTTTHTLPDVRTPLALALCLHAAVLGLMPLADISQLLPAAQDVSVRVQQTGTLDAASALMRKEILRMPKRSIKASKWLEGMEHAGRVFDDNFEMQCVAFNHMKAARSAEDAQHRAAVFTHQSAGSLPRIPIMRVNLFGQFSVRQDDVLIQNRNLSRTKVRALLALLVIEGGRIFATDRLSRKLWPDSKEEQARHNLHATTSQLRHAIMLPGGECPYVQTQVGSIGLDSSLIQSDVADLDVLCRKLRFDEPDPEVFIRILEQIRLLYGGEILPGEDNALIVAARRGWTEKLVTSLCVGAQRLSRIDADNAALQLAQHALEIDPSREDCYELVMLIQGRLGQRPAAIDTWFSYCRYIDTELGLEPSERVKQLYGRIIS